MQSRRTSPQIASQSDDNEHLRRHAHRLMAELQQLRNMQKNQLMNMDQRNTTSQTVSYVTLTRLQLILIVVVLLLSLFLLLFCCCFCFCRFCCFIVVVVLLPLLFSCCFVVVLLLFCCFVVVNVINLFNSLLLLLLLLVLVVLVVVVVVVVVVDFTCSTRNNCIYHSCICSQVIPNVCDRQSSQTDTQTSDSIIA